MAHRATYSPEDNKLRLYPACRLDADTYQQVKAHGFKWAPKQEIFVAPKWTPQREDLLLELCGEIEDEDYSPLERSADRAERFEGYRQKRTSEALGHADTFDAGPSAFGHQNRARAERLATRHDRHRTRGVSQWSKAEYWNQRTDAVIRHALYKADPKVRRGRILKIEADLRGAQKDLDEAKAKYAGWREVCELEGADEFVKLDGWTIAKGNPPACWKAYALANHGHQGFWTNPKTGQTMTSLSCMLTVEHGQMTPREVAELYLSRFREPGAEDSYVVRWIRHYELRLSYERAMLENEGGSVAEVEIVPGGWFGRHQVLKVNKSRTTGKVVSVGVWGPHPWRTNADGSPEMGVQTINIQRMAEDSYRAPTPDELREFQKAEKARKAAKKATTPKAPSLINPTEEDAIRLQGLWNAYAQTLYEDYLSRNSWERHLRAELEPTEITRMTQAQYSSRSKGSYTSYETVTVCENGLQPRRWDGNKRAENPPIAFKVRRGPMGGGGFTHRAHSVVVITDKPQKPLPLDWEALEAPAEMEAVA